MPLPVGTQFYIRKSSLVLSIIIWWAAATLTLVLVGTHFGRAFDQTFFGLISGETTAA